METREALISMLRREFALQHVRPKEGACEALATALADQEIEFGKIGVSAAVIGYLLGRRF